ncbi:hypothetical protein MO973_03355 [Paenibacillus sp. TRM 82003]|uniref:hypothetical protein n=1 Tax=Kineococcus sp. TRM81007 TaxID=2925831 RepID=UPI001F56A808|nr:hypothetical protein [Kineococcus sp. TRM81007]MCI2239470.1 hypothetical protein [Kineococcus sp. TRM81007]MCI3919270.1 hypothetical protein [Paenibacillus sp. TRM 82003]
MDARPTSTDAAVTDDSIQVVRWDAPPWASRGLEVEGGWLHAYESQVVPLEGDEGAERPCPVRLECTDLAYAESGQTVLRRFGPRVFIGDTTQMSLTEARRLVAALGEVIERAEGTGR